MNRQLLIKLPNVPLATATIYGFTETSEEWGDNKHHIFDEINGYCHFSFPNENDEEGLEFNLQKLFDLKTDYAFLYPIDIYFVSEINNQNYIRGCYKNSTFYKDSQVEYVPYFIKCKYVDAVYFDDKDKILFPCNINSLLIPSETESKLLATVAINNGSKINLTISECIKNSDANIYYNENKIEEHLDDFDWMCGCTYQLEKKCSKINVKEEDFYNLIWCYKNLVQPQKQKEAYQMLINRYPSNDNLLEYVEFLLEIDYFNEAISLLNTFESNDKRYLYAKFLAYSIYDNKIDILLDILDKLKKLDNLDEEDHEFIEDLETEIYTISPNIKTEYSFYIQNSLLHLTPCPISINLYKYPLPEIYEKQNQMYIICKIREKGIHVTPEEIVRQKVLYYLLEICHVPRNLIYVEEPLSHYDHRSKDRMDILISDQTEEGYNHYMIIECKQVDIPLIGETTEQVFRYNYSLNAKYLVLINAYEALVYGSNENGEYIALTEFPDFEKMQNKIADPLHENLDKKKLPFDVLLEKNYLNQAYCCAENSSYEVCVLACNIYETFIDSNDHLIGEISDYEYSIIDDYGVTYKRPGNPSGGTYEGTYRFLKLHNNRNKEVYHIYFSVAATKTYKNDPLYGNRKGGSYIICAVDHKNQPLSILQLRLDKYINIEDDFVLINHDGIRSRKSSKETIAYVKKRCPKLCVGDKIILGKLPLYEEYKMNNPLFKEFLIRLANYVMLRYELKYDKIN